MHTVSSVAKYFLSLSDEEAGDTISNLKLQKLLYYAQGFHLALKDNPLFAEPIEAWTHGPVVPVVYQSYKHAGASAISRPEGFDAAEIDADTRSILDEVREVYGQFSAWKLRDMTHLEAPWIDAYEAGPSTTIQHSGLKKYFRTRLV